MTNQIEMSPLELNSVSQVGEKVGEDLRDTWHFIFLSLFSSCLLSFAWLLLMRLLAAPMLWLSILLAVLLLAATTAYCGLRLAATISSTDPSVSRNFLQVPSLDLF